MAKRNTYKRKKTGRKTKKEPLQFHVDWSKIKLDWNFLNDKRFRISLGLGLITFSFLLLLSFISALQSVKADQSIMLNLGSEDLVSSGLKTKNWLGLIGASLSHLFIYKWFGIAAFLLPPLFFAFGAKIAFGRTVFDLIRASKLVMFCLFWISLLLGYLLILGKGAQFPLNFYAGGMGYKLAQLFNSFVGFGTPFILILSLSIFLLYFFELQTILGFKSELEERLDGVSNITQKSKSRPIANEEDEDGNDEDENQEEESDIMEGVVDEGSHGLVVSETQLAAVQNKNGELVLESQPKNGLDFEIDDRSEDQEAEIIPAKETALALTVQKPIEEVIVEDMDEYDPTLDLSSYKRPPIELLNEVDNSGVKVTHEELQENKNKIVKTLNDFKIGISSIKATIGPTVTLYEIVPKAGVKISKIKNLEDDIALSHYPL